MVTLLAGNGGLAPGMTTPVFICYGAPASVSTAATEYSQFISGGASQWQSAADSQTILPISGTVSNLRIVIETAPGVGKSWTYALYKNGAATALTVTIADNALSGEDTSNDVSVSAGDTVSWRVVPSGTPTAPTNIVMSCSFTSTLPRESFLLAGSNNINTPTASTAYFVPIGGAASASGYNATEGAASMIIPTNGAISLMRVSLSGAPGAGTSLAFTVVKNGTPTAVTCTIADAATTGSDLSNSISVAAGDTISIQVTPTATPAPRKALFGVKFSPDINGESVIASNGTNPSTGATAFFGLQGTATAGSATAATTIEALAPVDFTLRKIYSLISTAPGAAKSRTQRSYINAGYGNLAAVTSGATDTTASDLVNTDSITAGDFLWFATDPAGTPTGITRLKIAAVAYIVP